MIGGRIGVEQRGRHDPHRCAVVDDVQRESERCLRHAAGGDERARIGVQRACPGCERIAAVHQHGAMLGIMKVVLECRLGCWRLRRQVSRLPCDLAQGSQLRIHGVRQSHPLVCCLCAAHLGRGTREACVPPLGAPADHRDNGQAGNGDDERSTRRSRCVPAQRHRATTGGEDARREITYARLGEPPAGGEHGQRDGRRREQRARTGGRQEPFFRVVQDDLLRNRHRRNTGVERRHSAAHQGNAAG